MVFLDFFSVLFFPYQSVFFLDFLFFLWVILVCCFCIYMVMTTYPFMENLKSTKNCI